MYTSADMKILQLIRLHLKIVAYFSRKNKLYERITGELLGFTMRNFQDIIFIWTQTYREIFKTALVYLSVSM